MLGMAWVWVVASSSLEASFGFWVWGFEAFRKLGRWLGVLILWGFGSMGLMKAEDVD